jgi:uncharacterized membrane protein
MKFFSISKSNLRRIFSIGLLSISLFLGSAIAFSSNNIAIAETAKGNTPGISGETVIDESTYESAKADRNQRQAARSQQADTEDESETVAEKLNIDEIKDTLSQ